MIEYLPEIPSTNTYLMQRCAQEDLPAGYTVCTFRQTAGRGQRGNGWESEPDKNISFTTILPSQGLSPEALWRQSMLTALAVAKALQMYDLPATIKWPNDIYVGDKKICGILIENVLQGQQVKCSLAGIGVNINQLVFVSNAPNPTSMAMLTGKEFDKKEVLESVLQQLQTLETQYLHDVRGLEEAYMQHLYRREGLYRWREAEVTAAPMMIDHNSDGSFLAKIHGITPAGCLVLEKEDGSLHTYHFKEIKYII